MLTSVQGICCIHLASYFVYVLAYGGVYFCRYVCMCVCMFGVDVLVALVVLL